MIYFLLKQTIHHLYLVEAEPDKQQPAGSHSVSPLLVNPLSPLDAPP